MINFDEGNLAAGTLITDQFEGINVSTPSEFGVMVFDTNNPTGEDYDLAAEIGNVLIISEDGDTSDPDDDAAGGFINIEFDEPSTVEAIGLLDIEETGGSLRLYDEESEIIEFIDVEPAGDGLSFELDISNSEVARLELNLAGSGALTFLDFSTDTDTSTEATQLQLTETGWSKDGQQLGTWTDETDVVKNFDAGIEVAKGVTVNTLGGNDLIFAVVSSGMSLFNLGTIITGNGDDYIQGNVIGGGNNNVGIFNSFENREDVIEVINTVGTGIAQQIINTEAGEDGIIGTVEISRNGNSNVGIVNGVLGSINTGKDNDNIIGTVEVGENGDFNRGIFFGEGPAITAPQIDTGTGDDSIAGTVEVREDGNSNSGLINVSFTNVYAGAGDDLITGTVEILGNGDRNTGIVNGEASINAEDGDDRIIGTVAVEGNGSSNQGIFSALGGIDLGAGDDYLYGAVEVAGNGDDNVGIYNNFSNTIDMGAGDDQIIGVGGDAYTSFGAAPNDRGYIRLGKGNDRIEGFGSNQFVNGGTGIDIAEFEFSLDESVTVSRYAADEIDFVNFDESISLGSNTADAIYIIANEKTMLFNNVEEFVFADETFSLDELILLS